MHRNIRDCAQRTAKVEEVRLARMVNVNGRRMDFYDFEQTIDQDILETMPTHKWNGFQDYVDRYLEHREKILSM